MSKSEEFEPCDSCKRSKKIEWCPDCIDKYFDEKQIKKVKVIQLQSNNTMFQKLGPCQLCGDHHKPCRCSLEKEILKLQKFKNDVIKICSVKSHTFKVYDLILDLIEKETDELKDKITTKKSE